MPVFQSGPSTHPKYKFAPFWKTQIALPLFIWWFLTDQTKTDGPSTFEQYRPTGLFYCRHLRFRWDLLSYRRDVAEVEDFREIFFLFFTLSALSNLFADQTNGRNADAVFFYLIIALTLLLQNCYCWASLFIWTANEPHVINSCLLFVDAAFHELAKCPRNVSKNYFGIAVFHF